MYRKAKIRCYLNLSKTANLRILHMIACDCAFPSDKKNINTISFQRRETQRLNYNHKKSHKKCIYNICSLTFGDLNNETKI